MAALSSPASHSTGGAGVAGTYGPESEDPERAAATAIAAAADDREDGDEMGPLNTGATITTGERPPEHRSTGGAGLEAASYGPLLSAGATAARGDDGDDETKTTLFSPLRAVVERLAAPAVAAASAAANAAPGAADEGVSISYVEVERISARLDGGGNIGGGGMGVGAGGGLGVGVGASARDIVSASDAAAGGAAAGGAAAVARHDPVSLAEIEDSQGLGASVARAFAGGAGGPASPRSRL